MNFRWALMAFVLLVSCGTCSDDVAELEAASGRVERDTADTRGKFTKARATDRFRLGDALRTGRGAMARLHLFPEGTALVQGDTLVRFMDELPGKQGEHIALEEGVVEIDAPLDLEVHTPLTVASLSRGSKVRVSASDEAEGFDVLVGRVSLASGGKRRVLSQGQRVELPVKLAAREPEPIVQSIALPDDTVADLDLPTEQATLHTPELPVLVRVPLPACPHDAAVEWESAGKRQRTTPRAGASFAVLPLEAGTHRIQVKCGRVAGTTTRVTVQRDNATLELPKTAPRIEVDADGRRYTVQYQNRLPRVSFMWRDARKAARYVLTVRSADGEVSYPTSQPVKELTSGALAEGEHTFYFSAVGGERSDESTLRIVFDNAARTAFLAEPVVGARPAGATVTVAGGALLSSSVSANGRALPLDGQGRFRAEVPITSEGRCLVVRVRHPGSGAHYYLRRLR